MKTKDTTAGRLKRASIISVILLMFLATIPAPNNIVTGSTTVTIDLSAGWNFKAMPESISASALALKSNYITNIVRVTPDGYYVSYIPSLGVTDFICEPNEAIYVYSDADTNITFAISTISGYVSGDLFVSGNTILDKDLTVNGSMSVHGDLEVNNLNITNDLIVSGNLTVGRNLTVGGLMVTYDITINGYLTVDRDVLVNGNITVMRDAIIYGNLTAGNFTVVNLTISEDLTINGDLTVSGNATIEGDLFVKGNITGLVFTNTVDYIIFKDGADVVYAKNGDTGAIDFQSTNASYVINSALSALPAGRGKVVLKGGKYSIDSTIDIPYGATLEGAGMGRNYKQATPDVGTVLDWTGSSNDVINYNSAGITQRYHRRGNGIYGMTVDGNSNSNAGIRVRNSFHHTIKDVTVIRAGGDGIVVEATFSQNIIDCDITGSGSDAISLDDFGGQWNTQVKIEGNEIGNSADYNIRITSGRKVSILKNWFENGAGFGSPHLLIDDSGLRDVEVRATDNNFGSLQNTTRLMDFAGGRLFLNHNYMGAGGTDKIIVNMTDGYLQAEGNDMYNCGSSGCRAFGITGGESALIKGNYILGGSGQTYSVHATGITHLIISDNIFNKNGIYTEVSGTVITGNKFYDNYGPYTINLNSTHGLVESNQIYGAYRNGIYAAQNYHNIVGNQIINSGKTTDNTYDAIIIEADNSIVDENHIYSDQPNKPRYGISATNQNYDSITDNYIKGTSTYDIYLTGGSNNKVIGNTVPDGKISVPPNSSYVVKDNVGFVTENTGTTSPGTLIVVTHGLDITPYRVIVTPLGNTSYYYVTNKGATDFTIISEASVAFEWYAVYDP